MSDPRVLAAGAGGLVAAAATLWAVRGLPFGAAVFLLAPFPLFAAGLAFGPGVAAAAVAVASAALALLSGPAVLLVFLDRFGAPVALLLAAGLRPDGRGGRVFRPELPLALLGLWPTAVLLGAALFFSGGDGMEAALRAAIETALARMGLAVPEATLGQVVRVKAAVVGAVSAAVLLFNGFAARRFLLRRGGALAAAVPPLPDPAALRLPSWYPPLPALAAGLSLAAPAGSEGVALSALLLLLVPLLVMGVAGVHARARGRPARVPMLVMFYILLAMFFLPPMGPALVGLGLYDQFRRRAAAPPTV